ncbi:hypothetical protein EU537_04490 [Candidatus Thorarchaeota archaeon]|nr:MAG: hypothetical protein EU537_04490 [Candidatus Thorarchaeota archaeon]
MERTSDLRNLLKRKGELFSEELGIDVERDPFKWLIASILFGGRISVNIAKQTYRVYEDRGLVTPEAIDSAWHHTLVKAHGEGGYTRYDGITADYMKAISQRLLNEYGGNVTKLDEQSDSPEELENKLELFQGIGPITTRIFLRELRGVWQNADPKLTDIEVKAARDLGIISDTGHPTRSLKEFWKKNKVEGYDIRNLEAVLVRHGLEIRRKGS